MSWSHLRVALLGLALLASGSLAKTRTGAGRSGHGKPPKHGTTRSKAGKPPKPGKSTKTPKAAKPPRAEEPETDGDASPFAPGPGERFHALDDDSSGGTTEAAPPARPGPAPVPRPKAGRFSPEQRAALRNRLVARESALRGMLAEGLPERLQQSTAAVARDLEEAGKSMRGPELDAIDSVVAEAVSDHALSDDERESILDACKASGSGVPVPVQQALVDDVAALARTLEDGGAGPANP